MLLLETESEEPIEQATLLRQLYLTNSIFGRKLKEVDGSGGNTSKIIIVMDNSKFVNLNFIMALIPSLIMTTLTTLNTQYKF